MKRVTSLLTMLVMIVAFGLAAAAIANAQEDQPASGGKSKATPEPTGPPVVLDATKPHDENLTLDIVEVVGCLATGPNNVFVLTDATDPVKAAQASTSQAALEADKKKPLGNQRYVVIGAGEWNPSTLKGHKMAVRGLMIKDAKETRINVTSFQSLDATCSKAK